MTQPTAKKTTHPPGDSKPERVTASKLRTDPPTPAEMVRAARSLGAKLNYMNKCFDDAIAAGMTESQAWQTVEGWQRAPSRPGLRAETGTRLALLAYAERTTLEDNRKLLAMTINSLALALVRGEITAAEALDYASASRADDYLEQPGIPAALEGVIRNSRKLERSKWQAVFNILAWDADVWPRPDTKSGLRGELKKLYESHATQESPPDVAAWVR
jgi:hypothetical protein